MRIALTLAAGMLLTGLGAASAAPAMPPAGLMAADTVTSVRSHHDHHHAMHGRTTKAERMARRRNTHIHGNPNARNPERPGYMQQLGNTTNGPRY